MPEMGGRKCFKELLKINPKVKVLIVSGYTSATTEKEAFELGAGGFVKKPYDPTQLLQTIRDVLG
jgi:DNA-binding NarL/FixJ family response regulator